MQRGKRATIYVVGGAAMAIQYDARRVTRDVDAITRGGAEEFWDAAKVVGQRHDLGPEWVNSHAAAFLSSEPDDDGMLLSLAGLEVRNGSAEHLLAMKLRSLRARDMDDLEVLFGVLGISDPQQAADIHDRLFDELSMGYGGPEESLYAARQVFKRAAAQGRPIGGQPDRP